MSSRDDLNRRTALIDELERRASAAGLADGQRLAGEAQRLREQVERPSRSWTPSPLALFRN